MIKILKYCLLEVYVFPFVFIAFQFPIAVRCQTTQGEGERSNIVHIFYSVADGV